MKKFLTGSMTLALLSSCATQPPRPPIDKVYWNTCMAHMERAVTGAFRKSSGKTVPELWDADVQAANACGNGPVGQFQTAEQLLRFNEAWESYKLAMKLPSASTVAEFVRGETYFNFSLHNGY